MTYTPRTISFQCELLHPASQVHPGPLQKLHDKLARVPGRAVPLYSSFSAGKEGVVLSNPEPQAGAASQVAFLSDRLQFREELTGVTEEEFSERVSWLCAHAWPARALQAFVAQQVIVRTLVNLRHFSDSRAFLRDGMFHFREELERLQREPQLLGLRLVFPATEDDPSVYALRIESFHSDPRSLYVESQGTFPPMLAAAAAQTARANIRATYRFATERVLRFIAAFDARQKA